MAVVVAGVLVFAGSRPPDEGTSDDRLYSIAEQLKCLQCVGESVAASQSPLAQQFRDEIGTQMAAGESDDEILAFFSERYGDEVLLDPPASGVGALAWLLPVVVAGGAIVGLGFAFTRWRNSDGTESGPRIDEVVTVGTRRAGAATDSAEEASGGGAEPQGDSELRGDSEPSSGKGLMIAGGVGAFAVIVGLLLVTASGERGDGEITGATLDDGSGSSGTEACQPLAMSDPESGVECYDEILDSDPEDAEALTYRGWAQLRAGNFQEGRADLSEAIGLAPDYADPHVFLAIASVDDGDFDAASQEMQLFWDAEPTAVAVSVVQSEGLERKIYFGLMSAATRDCWQVAAEAAPEGAIDQAFLDALAGCLEEVLAEDPVDADARLSQALAKVGAQGSDPAAARSLLEGLLAEDPSNSDALALLVSLDISQGELDAAGDALVRLEELPRGPASFLIGDAATLSEALEAARQAAVQNPEGG